MMRQYAALKAQHSDAILFFRMGDFYEMFGGDAELAAPLLEIALTTRDKGKPDAVPMCGVPVHSVDVHVRRLAELGHRVAICEQVEDPRAGAGRGLVRREVVEVVTPGLAGETEHVDAARAVALAAVVPGGCEGDAAGADASGEAGLAVFEAATGSFRATRLRGEGPLPAALLDELERVAPREVLWLRNAAPELAERLRARLPGVALTGRDAASFDPAGAPAQPDGFDAAARDGATRAAAAVLDFVARNQPFALRHLARLRHYRLGDGMRVGAAARAHLELFESLEDRSRRGTLFERIDRSTTPLGARRLAEWLSVPLLDPAAIRARQDGVAWLAERDRLRARLRAALGGVRDLDRLLARVARPGATPRDLGALRDALAALPAVAEGLDGEGGALLTAGGRPAVLQAPEPVPEVVGLLSDALVDDPPAIPRGSRGAGETGYVREGFRSELDGLRESARKGREWIAGLEARERERSGIASLRVRFHPVHGYGLEVTKSNLSRVPGDWERKQTLAGSERFTTAELREVESRVRGAHERAAALEREIFEEVRQASLAHALRVRAAADAVASLDALASLAEVAREDGWVRPEVDDGEALFVRGGRHPVVEHVLRRRGGEEFVPNDSELDPAGTQILLVTGPNMSGKSTYLRQVALLVLLAQIGSFVPAESARLGVVDRIFTRIGAADRLARGESTFMVEMRECAAILAQASRRSLVILDEIGRGTSTFDGLSIAWAVAEYLHDTPGLAPRTLFATHYHELADLARTRARVSNAHFEVREWGHEVVFLRRLVAGAASRSYGIQVARLAGLPEAVVRRSREILHNLESGELDARGRPRFAEGGVPSAAPDQLALFAPREGPSPAEREVLEELQRADPDRLAPVDALLLLQRCVQRLREGPDGGDAA
jgi:DNA mismatch repair protein MutS